MPKNLPVPSAQQESVGISLQPAPTESGAITVRAMVVGAVLCVILSLVVPYNLTNVQAGNLALDHNAPGAIALFFFLVAGGNLLLRNLARLGGDSSFLKRLPLSVPELLTVYVMLVVSCALCTMGLAVQLPPIIAAPHYYGAENHTYAELINRAGGSLPSWLIINDDTAVRGFYEGLAGGKDFWPQFLKIFTAHWLRPLAFWAIFLFAVYGAMACIMVIFRKQWMEREVLVYPLTKLPLAMVEPDPQGRLVNPLFRNKLMWLGFLIPVIICSLLAMTRYVPSLTMPNIGAGAMQWTAVFFENLLALSFRISLPALAFAFLVNLEVSFSVWAFGIFGILLMAGMNYFGLRFDAYTGSYGAQDSEFLYHLGIGSVLALVGYSLWVARSHLRNVVAKAIGLSREVDDSREILSYRSAFFGLLLCTIVMVVWLVFSGMSAWLAVIFLAVAFALFYALARVVAEAGVAAVVAPSIAPTTCVLMLGGPAVGVGGLVSLALSYVWAADLRAFVMAPVANGLKVINGVRRKKGRLIWAIFLAIVITFVLSQGLIIYQAYRIGGINASPWFFQEGPQVPYRYINTVRNQYWSGPDPTGWFLAAIGTGLMLALLLARRRFAWWPLHPIGLVVLGTWIMVQLWFSFFLAWLIKLILIRYGGPHLYAKAVPFFLGMILGQFSACAVWAVIFYLTSVPGVNLFWV